jgi:hypothetical protein
MALQNLKEELQRIHQVDNLRKVLIKEDNITFDSVFTTDNVDLDIYHIEAVVGNPDPNDDIETSENKCSVVWEIEPEMRNWGIKWMGVSIKNIVTTIHWYIEEYDEKTYNTYTKNSGDIEFQLTPEWEIVNDLEFQKDGQIYPTSVQIDFARKIVNVS